MLFEITYPFILLDNYPFGFIYYRPIKLYEIYYCQQWVSSLTEEEIFSKHWWEIIIF